MRPHALIASSLLAAGAMALGGSLAMAQTVPAPALDAPRPPLAGLPPNQPSQLQPEMNPSSDPAMSNANTPGVRPGLSKVQKECARLHPGYNPATQSYVDAAGRNRSCG